MSNKNNREKKTTNEKPISLYPIPFEEAVRDLLAVKSPPEGWTEEKKQRKVRAKKK